MCSVRSWSNCQGWMRRVGCWATTMWFHEITLSHTCKRGGRVSWIFICVLPLPSSSSCVIYFTQTHICQGRLCFTEVNELVMRCFTYSISHVGKPSMGWPVSIKEEEHEMENPSQSTSALEETLLVVAPCALPKSPEDKVSVSWFRALSQRQRKLFSTEETKINVLHLRQP